MEDDGKFELACYRRKFMRLPQLLRWLEVLRHRVLENYAIVCDGAKVERW